MLINAFVSYPTINVIIVCSILILGVGYYYAVKSTKHVVEKPEPKKDPIEYLDDVLSGRIFLEQLGIRRKKDKYPYDRENGNESGF